MSEEENVLSPEESDALLDASDSGAAADVAESGIRDIESTYWEQVAPDRLPSFDSINESIAEALGEIWSEMFKKSIEINAAETKWLTGREVIRRVENDECVTSIDVSGNTEQSLVIITMDTVSAMVDLYFGGTGTAKRSARLTSKTTTEGRLLNRFLQQLVAGFITAWQRHGQHKFAVSAEPFDADTCGLCEPRARVVSSTWIFTLGENEHVIEVLWPAEIVEALRANKPKALPSSQERPELDWTTRIRDDMKGARIELRAVTNEFGVRLLDISRAKPGDIIPTDTLKSVKICVGDRALFEGTLGTHRGFNAVKIRRPINSKHLENG